MRKHILLAIALALGIAGWACYSFTSATPPEESYYMMIFAYEGTPSRPNTAHTFAVFVKAAQGEDNANAAKVPLEAHTISWLQAVPDSLLLLLRPPEQGKNYDLDYTLQFAASQDYRIAAWGPYRIKKELYDRALQRIDRLNSGAIAYKATDRILRPAVAVNCFHAISDMVDGPLLDTGTAFGEPASQMVRDHLSPWVLDKEATHRWVAERLDLGKYPISYRD